MSDGVTTEKKQTYHEQQIAQALLDGFSVVVASGRDIQVDLDGAPDVDQDALEILRRAMAIEVVGVTPSKTPGNFHAYLRADRDLTELERVCVQTLLGSDRKREAMGLLRIWTGDTPISVFFEKSA